MEGSRRSGEAAETRCQKGEVMCALLVIVALVVGFVLGGETRWWIIWRQSDRQTWLDWQAIALGWKRLYHNQKAMYQQEKEKSWKV